jgi:hypothetical protein
MCAFYENHPVEVSFRNDYYLSQADFFAQPVVFLSCAWSQNPFLPGGFCALRKKIRICEGRNDEIRAVDRTFSYLFENRNIPGNRPLGCGGILG